MTTESTISAVPANEASSEDLQNVFGTRGYQARCQCQHFRIRDCHWTSFTQEERAHRLRAQTDAGHPGGTTTSGLVAYLDGQPVGWCAVEPRTAYLKLLTSRVPWTGRDEDKTDDPGGAEESANRAVRWDDDLTEQRVVVLPQPFGRRGAAGRRLRRHRSARGPDGRAVIVLDVNVLVSASTLVRTSTTGCGGGSRTRSTATSRSA